MSRTFQIEMEEKSSLDGVKEVLIGKGLAGSLQYLRER